MKIAMIGGFRPDYTVGLEYSYARAFVELGHEVAMLPERHDFVLKAPSPLSQFEEWIRVRRSDLDLEARVVATGAPIVVIVKGRTVSAATVARLRGRGQRVVSVFPDNPFEGAASGVVARGLLAQYRALERIFVHDRLAVGQLRQLGVSAEFIAFARDPLIHDAAPPQRPGPDAPNLVFLGNPDQERIRYLRAVCDLNLAVYGAWDWAKLAPGDALASCVRGYVQLGPSLVSAMRNALCSVNVLRHSQKTAHNMRTFEIPACGACAVSEASIGVEEFMTNGVDVLTFKDPDELRRIAQRLRESPALAQDIASAGYERVRGETYVRRAEQILARF